MSLHYILDGYNIIHQISGFSSGSLEEQRQKLIRYIEKVSPQGSDKNMVTIVFDGRADIFGNFVQSAVKVFFSQNESADDKIKRLVLDSEQKSSTIVVTNDRDIQYSVRSEGAKAISVEEFFGPSKKFSTGDTKDNKAISKSVEFKINAELEKIWLKEKHK
jgi:predicted RNA-binding protein with PIN domain